MGMPQLTRQQAIEQVTSALTGELELKLPLTGDRIYMLVKAQHAIGHAMSVILKRGYLNEDT